MGGDRAAVMLNNLLTNRQSNARAGIHILPVEPFERLENIPQIFLVKTNSIIADGYLHHTFVP